MFTGIVAGLGAVKSVGPKRGQTRSVAVAARIPVTKVKIGDSVAVNGVCLTVTSKRGTTLTFDLGPETLARTTLNTVRVGARVHLELALAAGAPIGGHLVAGHIDGTGRVVSNQARGRARALVIGVPGALAAPLVDQGSIAIDGVSLTLNRVERTRVDGARAHVMLIPHTLAVTTLGERRTGDRVNIEIDPLAKQVTALVAAAMKKPKRSRSR